MNLSNKTAINIFFQNPLGRYVFLLRKIIVIFGLIGSQWESLSAQKILIMHIDNEIPKLKDT